MMQVLGGHCLICHGDYEGNTHVCGGMPTSCTDNCSIKYRLPRNTIEDKLDYIIALLERHEGTWTNYKL